MQLHECSSSSDINNDADRREMQLRDEALRAARGMAGEGATADQIFEIARKVLLFYKNG